MHLGYGTTNAVTEHDFLFRRQRATGKPDAAR